VCAGRGRQLRNAAAKKHPLKKEQRERVLFLPHPRNRATGRYTVASGRTRSSRLLNLPATPDSRPNSCTHPQPLPPRSRAPARLPLVVPTRTRPKAETTLRRRSRALGKRGPALTDGLPTATAIVAAAAAAAPAAPGCSPPTLAAASARAPAGLPRAFLAAAPCSRPTPARSQQHLLPPRRRPSRFIRATWPPALGETICFPRKGCEPALRARQTDGGRWAGSKSGSADPDPL
jgi:hypothetical protein